MANKFLGEAGLDVLASQIKTRVYVGQMVDELKAALEFFKETGVPNEFITDEQYFHGSILSVAAWSVLSSIIDGKDMSTAEGVKAAYDELIHMLNDVVAGGTMTTDDLVHRSALCEFYLFNNPGSGTTVEEITAQEVTDKFNS